MSEQIIRRFHPLTEHPNEFVGMTDARYGDYVRYSDVADHLASREADKAEIGRLRELVYVPGQWRCAKCNLTITRTVMSAATGQMHADHEPASCPNGCGPLWQITERDERRDAQRSFIDQFDELHQAKARIAELESVLSDLKVKQADSLVNTDQFVDANKKVDADHVPEAGKMVDAEDEAVRRNAERYRWLRSRENSLERRQWDKRIDNGTSCYHIVDEIRELKWGADLDTAIDAAIAAAKESK